MERCRHPFVAWCLLVGLLLVQVSGGVLACPLLPADPGAPALPAMHEGCSGHPTAPAPAPADTALCALHCQTALTVPATPAPPVALVGGEPLLVPVFRPSASLDDAGAARCAPPTMATAPPAAIRFCRFQI